MNHRYDNSDRDGGQPAERDDDLRYRAYQPEPMDRDAGVNREATDDRDDFPRQPRVADGWASEKKTSTPWYVTAGIALVSIVVVISLLASFAVPIFDSSGGPAAPEIEYVPARVIEVLDVRTIRVEVEGELATVRYIGVEPLPAGSDWRPVGVLANAQLVADREVMLEADAVDVDEYGRLLRYVYADQNLVNGLLVRNGLAMPSEPVEGLDRHAFVLQGWTEAAQFESLGHWSGVPPSFADNVGNN